MLRKTLAVIAVAVAVFAPSTASADLRSPHFGVPPKGCYTKTQEAIPYSVAPPREKTRLTGRTVANCKKGIRQIDNFSWIEVEVPRRDRTTYWDAIGSESIDEDERYTRGSPTAPILFGTHRYRTCAIYTFTTERSVYVVGRCSPAVSYTRYMLLQK